MDKLKTKVKLLLGVSVLGLLSLLTFGVVKDYYEFVDARYEQLQTAVQSQYAIIEWYYKQTQDGKMTKEAAQDAAKNAIRAARYGGKNGHTEYFFIWTLDGISVMHPVHPEWEGVKDGKELKTPSGRVTILELLDAIKKSPTKSAFVDTLFPHPGQTEYVRKVQYVDAFEPWGWMIGSGVYMDDVNQQVLQSVIISVSGGLTVLVIILIVGIYLMKSVIKQIGGEPRDAIELMKEVSLGNLTVNISTQHENSLMFHLNHMVQSLSHLVQKTKTSAQEIALASNEISQGNMNLSVRTEQTASNLQETAAAMHQIATSISSSSNSASQATSLTKAANETAIAGGKVMSEVMEKMKSIQSSSVKITDITSVIDSIAFQTNILALNAAVEAARAGEQGKGFAVVASEVRSLAQKSATAAKEIKHLISTSSMEVNEGSELVTKAGKSMNDIVQSVEKVNVIIKEIDVSTNEQSKGIAQVNNSISQLDSMTQQNSALVEEAAAAASSLNDQANSLANLVEKFQVK